MSVPMFTTLCKFFVDFQYLLVQKGDSQTTPSRNTISTELDGVDVYIPAIH